MKIVGCDLHTRYQQIAMLDRETGELIERRLEHESRVPRSLRFLQGAGGGIDHTAGFLTLIRIKSQSLTRTSPASPDL
jgi:hypothetical protein